jgi:DNA-binding NarL/FixJ family response regulator
VVVLRRSAADLELAHSLAALGGAVRRRGHRSAARAPLREALDLARRCGAQRLVHQVDEELAAAGASFGAATPFGVTALTPSELRVARLAAAGSSNRDIAQELFLTPKTIEMHLSSAYRKLQISSRRQLPEALPNPLRRGPDQGTR